MFVSFLMPHVDRGAGPLFHLTMLLQMSRFAPDEICFIGDDGYFAEEHVPFGEELALGAIRFTCVGLERYRAYRKIALPFAAVAPVYADGQNHLDAFQALLTRQEPALVAALAGALDALAIAPDDIEAFLTWSNCPSLSAFAAGIGKPVIHNELGPLRAPMYHDTVYFDFRGVNGNTTPAAEWAGAAALADQLAGVQLLSSEQLRSLLYRGAPLDRANADASEADASETERYPLGVALQVEDDSNTVAYGRGYDAIRLLYQGLRNLPPERVLVRSHPSARMAYRGGLGEVDTSPSSLTFLRRIDHLLTINSSVAAEAVLWNVPFTTLGDTPFGVLSTPAGQVDGGSAADAAADDALRNALMLGYLVPGALLYDPDYYRWRLAGATLRDCHARHLQLLRRDALHEHPGQLPPLTPRAAPEAAGADEPYRNRALWTASQSLSRKTRALGQQVVELEAQLATAIAERDKNWDERCWFRTNLERVENEIKHLQAEHDNLRLALARQQGETDALRKYADDNVRSAQHSFNLEADALRSRYADLDIALADVRQRFAAFDNALSQALSAKETAEAQSVAVLDELHHVQRELIEALNRGTALPRTE